MVKFGNILEEARRKPYDLLDTSQTIFERDFLEFNVHISDLETAVQVTSLHCFKHDRRQYMLSSD